MSRTRVIGVDLGGTKMLAAVVDEQLAAEHATYHRVESGGQERLLDDVAEQVHGLLVGAPDVQAVGFGIPCTIDRSRGVAVNAVNLPLADVPFAALMEERLGLPVFVDNDANVAALAEQRCGAARGARVALMLTVGTGIGGGIVIDGQLLRGSHGAGAELGHVVVDMDGPRCQGHCPNRGCLEAVASGTALAREAKLAAERDPSSALARAAAEGRAVTGELVTEAARAGDETALGVLELIGRRLGVGIASLVNVFEPDVVVIGGGVAAAGEMLLEPARAEMRARALPPGRDTARIVAARFGERAGMLGAAAMALDELER